jgi:PAS domain S-box-containing protein
VAAINQGASAFITKDGDPDEIVGAILRAGETARLRRENLRLREIQNRVLSSIPDLLVLADENLEVFSVNHQHRHFCTMELSQALGRPLGDVVSGEVRDNDEWREILNAARQSVEHTESLLTVREANGSASIFSVGVVRVSASPSPLILFRLIDVTESIELERRLSESESLAALGRMASTIAHEIRNPIAGIRALVQLLKPRFGAGDPDQESIDEILRLADRMTATLSDLLSFAKPGDTESETVELGRLLEDVAAETARWPSRDGRHLETRLQPDHSMLVAGRRERLFGAIANLLENAFEAAPPQGAVRLSVESGAEHCEVTVEDSGAGVADEDRMRLFRPFFTTKTRGTGLGLSIVKKTVDACGGEIEVTRSEELGGACFRVRFPVVRRAAGEPA